MLSTRLNFLLKIPTLERLSGHFLIRLFMVTSFKGSFETRNKQLHRRHFTPSRLPIKLMTNLTCTHPIHWNPQCPTLPLALLLGCRHNRVSWWTWLTNIHDQAQDQTDPTEIELTRIYVYIYIYMYVCMYVCVCVRVTTVLRSRKLLLPSCIIHIHCYPRLFFQSLPHLDSTSSPTLSRAQCTSQASWASSVWLQALKPTSAVRKSGLLHCTKHWTADTRKKTHTYSPPLPPPAARNDYYHY